MRGAKHQQLHTVAACYLGWTLDAFDFFIMSFALDDVARDFSTTRTTATWAFTLTLMMRPVGAFLFGRIADRFGRRPTLMVDVLLYSALEFASGFAPSLAVFLILRAAFGVAMGGEWGVGASLTMESIPQRWRGPVSGLLQAGYPSGFLIATVVFRLFYASVGWRGMFMIGAAPALLVLYIRRSVPESPDWQARTAVMPRQPLLAVIRQHIPLTIFAIAMMTAFNFFSHGTQDLFPSFLLHGHGLTAAATSDILIGMNIAAIIGGLFFGWASQRIGRRRAIVGAALLTLPVLPFWAFSSWPWAIGVAAFLMQFGVQGAWGVVPAHLNELSPPEIRGTFPGFTYQIGNFLASGNATLQSALAVLAGGLAWPLAGVAGIMALAIALLVGFGPEARQVHMGRITA